LAKVYLKNASYIGSQSVKFLVKFGKATAAFVRSSQNTSVSGLCVWRHPQTPETEVFWNDHTKAAV